MQGTDRKEKDHAQFIALITAKIAKFSNQMVEYLISNLHSNNKCKKSQKNSSDSEEQNSKESDQPKKDEQVKRKYSKARTRLPIDTDCQRPKAPTSSFLIYYHENKKELAAKFGESNVSKLTKLASLVWKELPEEERTKYQKISEESKERYQKEMLAFKAKYADKIQQALKKRRAEYRMNWLTKKKAKKARQKENLSQNSSLEFQSSNIENLK